MFYRREEYCFDIFQETINKRMVTYGSIVVLVAVVGGLPSPLRSADDSNHFHNSVPSRLDWLRRTDSTRRLTLSTTTR